MDRVAKETFVTELRDRLNKAPVVYLTDFTGLDVKEMTGLRRSLKESGAEYLVVKNRLAKLAFAETELPDITENLEGPTGMVFGYDEPVAPAKAVSEFAKLHNKKPTFKLGIMDAKILDISQIDRIAKLPSHEALLAQLAGVMEAPLVELASVLGAKLQEMAGLLGALQEKGPEEPAEEEEAAEEPAEEEAAEEPAEEEAAEEPAEEEAAEEEKKDE
ncbi:MAG: 50S ribosomal protein L10 [Gemmatimonadota bacterium]|nr:50S ribosomal protein L10 [Gemmatimonadota bacterium]